MFPVLWLALIAAGRAQLPTAPFPVQQAPFQQRPQGLQSSFQRQRQQAPGQGIFPAQGTPLNPLNPLNPNPLNPLTPIGAAVQNPYRYNQYSQQLQQNYVPITAYLNELNLDGSFSYGYAAADGTTAQAQGYVKNLGYGEGVEAQVSSIPFFYKRFP